MEFLTRCGRCGALVETTSERFSNGTVYYAPCAATTVLSSNNVVSRDGCEYTVLCPDCMEGLKAWLADEPQPQGQEGAGEGVGGDSWERLRADVAKPGCCEYFQGRSDVEACDGCPALEATVDCGQARATDVVRRAKALAGVR